jgi:hypothetical protein
VNPPTVKRLPSGYWLVSWGPNQWFQWQVGTAPTLAGENRLNPQGDGFGWVDEAMRQEAIKATTA